MHHSQDAPHLPLAGKNRLESLPSSARVLKSAIYQASPAPNHLLQLGTEFQFPLLRMKEYAHQSKRIFVKDLPIFIIDEVSVAVESVEMLGLQFPLSQKTKDRTCFLLGLYRQQKAVDNAGSSLVNRSSVLVVITHELFASP